MENLEYFLLDQNYFSLDHEDFSLKEKSVFKMRDLEAKNIRDLAEKAKDYARYIIVKIGNYPGEYNKLELEYRLSRRGMIGQMRDKVTGVCFALSDFTLEEFNRLKSCVENEMKKKQRSKENSKSVFGEILYKESNTFYKYISFSKNELRLISEILIKNNFSRLSDKILDKNPIDINLESNAQFNFVTEQIDIVRKYSFGHCNEIAIIAMEYIAEHGNQVSAELFEIAGGDHAFLVVNRAPKSNPHDPLTWGEAAYICDPWANKVYPAKEYLGKLKNLKNVNSKIKLESFNPEKHKISPLKNLNADLLRNAYSKAHLRELVETFNEKLEKFSIAFNQLKNLNIFKTVKINHFDQKIHDIMTDIRKSTISNSREYVENHSEKGYMTFKNELEEKLSQFQNLYNKYSNFLQQLVAKNNQLKHEKKSLFFSEENNEELHSKAMFGCSTTFPPF